MASCASSFSMSTSSRDPQGYTYTEIPPFVQYTSPVSSHEHGSQLPLNLIARIVSYLDDVGDIARVTRTSRLLYYMTLPQLYERVALHSYSDIRYVDGRPEGFGSGSPFMMALNGLVTKSYAGVVKDFRVWGEWREVGVEDFAKGRVPDNSMMLNMMLRACVDKMAKLRAFSWELDCKPLKTLYQGLAGRNTLTSLTIKFPSSRLPRPSVCIPPMPNLKVFAAIDIDPLCYPDDISVLIHGSKNLVDLRLHFAPRMRRTAEPSLSLDTYFGRCFKHGDGPRFKHIAMQNFFGPNSNQIGEVLNLETCASMTYLDVFGGAQGGDANIYVDDTWKDMPPDTKFHYRTMRFNEFAPQHVNMVKNSTGAERVYIVGDRSGAPGMSSTSSTQALSSKADADYITPEDSPSSSSTANAAATSSSTGTNPTRSSRSNARSATIASFGPLYLNAFTTHHGSTLQHLLLAPDWALTATDLGTLIRCCPNLTQLGLALAEDQFETLRLLVPFLPKIFALRVLDPDGSRAAIGTGFSDEEVEAAMGRDIYQHSAAKIRWVGDLGRVWKIGGEVEALCEDGSGRREMRRVVRSVAREEVGHVEIWRLDCLDLMADRGAVG
jgi:hypothetical protein